MEVYLSEPADYLQASIDARMVRDAKREFRKSIYAAAGCTCPRRGFETIICAMQDSDHESL